MLWTGILKAWVFSKQFQMGMIVRCSIESTQLVAYGYFIFWNFLTVQNLFDILCYDYQNHRNYEGPF